MCANCALWCPSQVIEEIEEMMQESPDPEEDGSSITYQSDLSNLSEDLQALKHSQSNSSYQDRKTHTCGWVGVWVCVGVSVFDER